MRELLDEALKICQTPDERSRVTDLLVKYADVFSKGESDVGRTDLVSHSIPVEPGTVPIRQPPRRLGAEKDKEVEVQVAELLRQGMVEPGGSLELPSSTG
jgi:hypothetical protein